MSKQDGVAAPPNRTPRYVGLGAALIAILLSVFGMVRASGLVSLTPVSLLLVVLIAGGSWGIIAWAITTAVYDVEADITESAEGEPTQESE